MKEELQFLAHLGKLHEAGRSSSVRVDRSVVSAIAQLISLLLNLTSFEFGIQTLVRVNWQKELIIIIKALI